MEAINAIIEHREQIAAYLLVLLVSLTGLSHVLHRGAHALEALAIKTVSKRDDAAAHSFAVAMDRVVAFLDVAVAFMPRIGFGAPR